MAMCKETKKRVTVCAVTQYQYLTTSWDAQHSAANYGSFNTGNSLCSEKSNCIGACRHTDGKSLCIMDNLISRVVSNTGKKYCNSNTWRYYCNTFCKVRSFGQWAVATCAVPLVSLPVSTPLRVVNRCWSGFPCKWRYINVETFNLFFFLTPSQAYAHIQHGSQCVN